MSKAATERRVLRFSTLEELRAEVTRLIDADRIGKLRSTGNWSLGQSLGHLASWIDYAFDGVPVPPPRIVGWFVKILIGKRAFIEKPMRVGLRIPRVAGGTFGIEPMSLDDGARKFTDALNRFERSVPTAPHPFFGLMTRDEWNAMQFRHAELHLSFFHVVP